MVASIMQKDAFGIFILKKMGNKKKEEKHDCPHCGDIPEYKLEDDLKGLPKHLSLLKALKGNGRYYRGETLQLTTYQLYQCEKCEVYYEYGHHYYSDPESTMGLYREEDDWWVLKRLDEENAEKRLKGLRK
jgi:ribosomal protein L37AE/L43A